MSFSDILKSTGMFSDSGAEMTKTAPNADSVAAGNVRFLNAFPYAQNPFQPIHDMGIGNPYHGGYGLLNNNYGLKVGEPTAYGPPSAHGPTSYGTSYIGHPGPGSVSSHPRHKHKSNASAMSALTLLAFLFFLNILQNCLKDQMGALNPTVMVMTAGVGRQKQSAAADLESKGLPDYEAFASDGNNESHEGDDEVVNKATQAATQATPEKNDRPTRDGSHTISTKLDNVFHGSEMRNNGTT